MRDLHRIAQGGHPTAMTVQTVGWVLDHSASRGYARLVLISLANHANRLGASCHPSLTTIAGEAGVGRATAVRAIEALERDGEIVVRRGVGRGNENRYVLTMGRDKSIAADLFDDPEGARKGIAADQIKGSPADQLEGEKVRKRSGKGPLPRAHVDIRPSDSIKPQATEERERGNRRGENGTAARRTPSPVPNPFPITEEMRRQAESYGVAADRIDFETEKFVDKFTEKGERKLDWLAAWRNWMRRVQDFGPRPPTNGVGPRSLGSAAARSVANGVVGRSDGAKQREIIGR